MDYKKNMDMYVEIHEEQLQNPGICACMHEVTLKSNS